MHLTSGAERPRGVLSYLRIAGGNDSALELAWSIKHVLLLSISGSHPHEKLQGNQQ